MNNVNKYYFLFDKACMLLYEKLNIDYLNCFIRVSNDILMGVDESKLDDKSIKKLESIYKDITSFEITNDEVRQANELLIIKCLKHVNGSLDLMTPDYICYLFSFIIEKLFEGRSLDVSIMDVEVGSGNLLNSISNYVSFNTLLYGVENNEMMVKICQANCDTQGNDAVIYYQDTLHYINDIVDVVVGDIDSVYVSNNYMPYKIINKYLNNLGDDGYFIYLIENDFFSKNEISEFKNEFNGTFLGLIVLPDELFNTNHVGKSILIGTNRKMTEVDMMILKLTGLKNKEKFSNEIKELEKWIDKIKEKK